MTNTTQIFKILSDDTRLRILLLLKQTDLCVCEMSGILNVPQPKVSKNLAKLRDLNMVEDLRKEKFVYYSLKKDDALLMQILDTVMTESKDGTQFRLDLERMKDKDIYLNQCQAITEIA